MKVWGRESRRGIYQDGGRGGDQKRRWVQDITDDLRMSALDTGHLTYDLVVFRMVVKGEMFRQAHATE
jgi:hypothetical protein